MENVGDAITLYSTGIIPAGCVVTVLTEASIIFGHGGH